MAELAVKIKTTLDNASVKKAFDDIGKKGSQSAKKLKKSFSGFGDTIKETGKGVLGALGPVALAGPVAAVAALATGMGALAVSSFKAAEQSKKVTSAFVNLSGGTQIATLNLQAMQNATRGLISETEQMQIANQLLGMNIVQTADQLEEVVGVSRRLGKEFRGLGAKDAAEEFAIMIANMSVARLDSFGLSSGRVRKRINELMKETQGMTREAAFFQATMEEGQKTLERLGPEITGAAEEVSRMSAEWANLRVVMGEAAEGTGVVKSLTSTIADQLVILRNWSEAGTDLATKQEALQIKIKRNEKAIKNANEGWFQSAAIANFWTKENEKLSAELSRVTNRLEVNTQAAKNQQEAFQNAIKSEELAQESLAKQEAAEKKFQDVQKQFAKDLIEIQNDTAKQLADSQDDFDDNRIKATEDNIKAITKLRDGARKADIKADTKLLKDRAKIDTNLEKALIKAERNKGKKIAKAQSDFKKQDKSEQKRKQIDALGDERLFQFELRNLAADGEGIAIKEALERRAIEQQIVSEKAEFEKEVESDKRKNQIESIKSEGVDRKEELKQQAQERKAELTERNEEAKQDREERLAEEILKENESFAQKKADLQEALTERNEKIKESERERIAEIAKGLAEAEELTEGSFDRLIALANEFGPEFGQAFADGMAKGFEKNLRVESLVKSADALTDKNKTGFGAGGGTGGAGPNRIGGIQEFQGGGILSSDGVFFGHQGEEVANPSEGQSITIGDETFAVREAEKMANAINAMRQKDMQELVDVVAANL